ncbi:MAG: plasmid partitioning protein RepB [Beijerinckiaceae bacterium]|nr:plasmid partitioning protein RepB [Beijerinckiaceae bacterium]
MARKNLLASASGQKLTAVNSDPEVTQQQRTPPAFAARGALGAVTRSIDELAARADAARDIEARLTAGATVVDLDPALIDSSFVADRLARYDDEEFNSFVEAIRARGQDSPILVRRSPTAPGRYQVAFGHRRLKAAKVLGRDVRAVVKDLTDRDLVLAQGQENSARADLSFVERALFAWRLEEGHYDRETIMAALNVDKTTVSRMISVATKIPAAVIEAIGPAPSIGRDRWVELAGKYQDADKVSAVGQLLSSEAFHAAPSDERFNLVLNHAFKQSGSRREDTPGLAISHRRPSARFWATETGQRVVRVTANDRALTLAIDKRVAPGFGDYLLSQMDGLYASYLNEPKED